MPTNSPSPPSGSAGARARDTPTGGVESEGLVRSLGLFTTLMLVIGGVIGSGIFRKPGVMAAQVGSPELLVGVWLLAGVVTIFGAITNAEIASMIPETGGQYVYFERMYGPFFAFLYGWAIFVIIQSGSIAAIAYIFAEYSGWFVPLPEFASATADWSLHLPLLGDVRPLEQIGVKVVAAGLIVVLTAVNYLGVRFGGAVQNLSTVAKVSAMILLVVGALLLPAGGSVANLTTPSSMIRPHGFAIVLAFAAALQGAFWAYDGWNKLTYIAGEIRAPQRNIPRALVLGLLGVTGVYLLVIAAYAYVLPIDDMAKSKLVAGDVAERCFRGGGRWIALGVMISTLGTANATILTTARLYFSMARRRVFPVWIGAAHPRFHTPSASLVVQCGWSVLLLFSGTFDTLTDTVIFVSWFFYAAGAYGVFVLRRKEPTANRPFKVPGYPYVPWVFVCFAAIYLVLTVGNDIAGYRAALSAGKPAMINSLFGTLLVLAGTPIYFLYRARRCWPMD